MSELFILEMYGIYERGVPNAERIVLRAHQPVDLSRYGLILGLTGRDNSIVPARDNFLWLGNIALGSPGWVFVYTGTGTPGPSIEVHTKEPLQVLYWDKAFAVFTEPSFTAALIQFGEVQNANHAPRKIAYLEEQRKQLTLERQGADMPAQTVIDEMVKQLTIDPK